LLVVGGGGGVLVFLGVGGWLGVCVWTLSGG
jgi:hypothetical protein